MANYKESTVTGSKWQRCRAVTIVNEYQQMPSAYFQEEEVVSIGTEVVKRDNMACVAAFDPVAGVIPLINPETGEPTGTSFSHADLYVVLHSLYLQAAAARDAAAA